MGYPQIRELSCARVGAVLASGTCVRAGPLGAASARGKLAAAAAIALVPSTGHRFRRRTGQSQTRAVPGLDQYPMSVDTFIFVLLFSAAWVIWRGGSRRAVLWLFAVSLVAVLLLFKHHVTDSLPLNF